MYSPDNRALRSREEVLRYLTAAGTCKCGLRCPFMLDETFNFDPGIIGLPDNIPFTSNSLCLVKPHLTLHRVKRRPPTHKTHTKPKPFSSLNKSIKKPAVLSHPLSLPPPPPPPPPHSINKLSKPTEPKSTPISNLINPKTRAPSPSGGNVVQTNVSYPVLNLHALVSHITTAASTKSNTTTSTSISLPWLMNAIQKQRSVSPSSVASSSSNTNSFSSILLVPSPPSKLSVPLVTSSPSSVSSLAKKKLLPKKPVLTNVEGFPPPATFTSAENTRSFNTSANSSLDVSSQSLLSSLSSPSMCSEGFKNNESNSMGEMSVTEDMSEKEGPFMTVEDVAIDKNNGSDFEGGAYLQKVEKVANEFFRSQENRNNNSTDMRDQHESISVCGSSVQTHPPQEPSAPTESASLENPNDLLESQDKVSPFDKQNKLNDAATSAVEERSKKDSSVPPPVSEAYLTGESFSMSDELSCNINEDLRSEDQPSIGAQQETDQNEQVNSRELIHELSDREPVNEGAPSSYQEVDPEFLTNDPEQLNDMTHATEQNNDLQEREIPVQLEEEPMEHQPQSLEPTVLTNEQPVNVGNEGLQEKDVEEGKESEELTEQEHVSTNVGLEHELTLKETTLEIDELKYQQSMSNTDNEDKDSAYTLKEQCSINVCKAIGSESRLTLADLEDQRERVQEHEYQEVTEGQHLVGTQFVKEESEESMEQCLESKDQCLESKDESEDLQSNRPEEQNNIAKDELPCVEEEGLGEPVEAEAMEEAPMVHVITTEECLNKETRNDNITVSANERDPQQCQPEQLMEEIDTVQIHVLENTNMPSLHLAKGQNTCQDNIPVETTAMEDGAPLEKGSNAADIEGQDSINILSLKETEPANDDEVAFDNQTRKQRKRKRHGTKRNVKPKPALEDSSDPPLAQNQEKTITETYDIEIDFMCQDDDNVTSSDQEEVYYPDKILPIISRDYHLRGSTTPPADSPVTLETKKGRKSGRAASSDGIASRKRKSRKKTKSRSVPSSLSGNRGSSSETIHTGEGKKRSRKRVEHGAIRWSTRRIPKRNSRGVEETISAIGGSPDSVFSGIQSPPDIPLLGGPSSVHDKADTPHYCSVVARKRMRSTESHSGDSEPEPCLVEDTQTVSQSTKGNKEKLIVSISRKSLPIITSYYTIRCHSYVIGDIVWARAPMLPFWPGKIISHKDWKHHKLKPAPKAQVGIFCDV